MPIPWHFKPNCTFISFFMTFCMIPCPILVALRHDTTCKFTLCILYSSFVFYWFSSHESFVLSMCCSAAINVCAYCVERLLQEISFIALIAFRLPQSLSCDSKKKKKNRQERKKFWTVPNFFWSPMIEEVVSNSTKFKNKNTSFLIFPNAISLGIWQ